MSKTNHTSYGAVTTSECELTEAELDAVVGGTEPLMRPIGFDGSLLGGVAAPVGGTVLGGTVPPRRP
jgi:hypothetical protein